MEPLKRLADLTHEEILAIPIGSERYLQTIDLECAHAGISLLPPHPGPKPETAASKPDTVLYKIGNWGFLKIEDAEEIIRLMTAKGLWRTRTDNGVQVLEPMPENDYYRPDIKSTPAYSATEFAKIKDTVAQQAAGLEDWNQNNKVYQEILQERKDIVKAFTTKVDYAREVTSGIAQILTNLKRYLVLAQGQYPIAVGFLKEADKTGGVHVEDDSVYYACTMGAHYPVITREQYQRDSMDTLLGVGHG